MKNNDFTPPHQKPYQNSQFQITASSEHAEKVKFPLGLLLSYLVRLCCILGLSFFVARLEFVFYLALEMTTLSLVALVLPRRFRVFVLPLIIMHVFQFVNVVLTGNYLLSDMLAGFMYGHGDFDQLFWTIAACAEGVLLWIPSLWAKSYLKVGKGMAWLVTLVLVATLFFNLPIHRLVVQELYAVKSMLNADYNRRSVVYHDSSDLW